MPIGTELTLPSLISLNESRDQCNEKDSPSKFLHQSSPIPKIPLSLSKRAKQSAEILNSSDKIIQKKTREEKKTKEGKKTKKATTKKTNTQKKQESLAPKVKTSCSKGRFVEKRGRQQKTEKNNIYVDTTSSETDSDDTNFIEVTRARALRKRKIQIYSSDSESEENYKDLRQIKGKASKGKPIKTKRYEKSNRSTDKILKEKNVNSKMGNVDKEVDDYCAECFENYNVTKSKSDWIQCVKCCMWVHESCTTFKGYCMRCGKLKRLIDENLN